MKMFLVAEQLDHPLTVLVRANGAARLR